MKTVSPTKQRKNLYQSKASQRYPLFNVPLTPELRKSRNVRSLVVVVGDSVRVRRGGLGGTEAKVTEVNRKDFGVAIEGITRQNSKGLTVPVYINPSNIIITKLNLKDKWREKILNRKASTPEGGSPTKDKNETESAEETENKTD